MLKKRINKLVEHYGLWRSIHSVLITALVILICVFLLEVAAPVRISSWNSGVSTNTNGTAAGNLQEILQIKKTSLPELMKVVRLNLFKAATPLRDKPMADKTVERIKSQLKLQCLMEMNGQRVAYINIKGVGLKKCCVGDCVNDLFTVLNINENDVEIMIVDHKVTLYP